MPTKISWSNETWNPTTGCSHVSDGCRFCYAETMSLKWGWSQSPWTARNAAENVKLHEDRLRKPYSWKKPSRVFVNSMSDLFHELVPDSFVAEVFAVMNDLPQHTFQVLTKRPERAADWPGPWGPNIWMGTSVEDQRVIERVDALRECQAAVRFLSLEPLLGPLRTSEGPRLDLLRIGWVIVGGESGLHLKLPENRGRWMDHAWARGIRDECVAANVPYFFKQSSGLVTEQGTALIEEDGSRLEWHQYPGVMAPPVRVA